MITVPKRYRRTDGQLTVASPRSALASRGKNIPTDYCSRITSKYNEVYRKFLYLLTCVIDMKYFALELKSIKLKSDVEPE